VHVDDVNILDENISTIKENKEEVRKGKNSIL